MIYCIWHTNQTAPSFLLAKDAAFILLLDPLCLQFLRKTNVTTSYSLCKKKIYPAHSFNTLETGLYFFFKEFSVVYTIIYARCIIFHNVVVKFADDLWNCYFLEHTVASMGTLLQTCCLWATTYVPLHPQNVCLNPSLEVPPTTYSISYSCALNCCWRWFLTSDQDRCWNSLPVDLKTEFQLNFNQLSDMNGLMRNDFCIILHVCVCVYLLFKLLLWKDQ